MSISPVTQEISLESTGINLVISTGIRISGYPNPEYLPESEITYSSTRIYALILPISLTLADRVQTYLDFINSSKNESIQLKSHPSTPFMVFYLSFILVVYALSKAGTL